MSGSFDRSQSLPIAAYVLAGGGSTRFGRDKALVEIEGAPMLARTYELVFDTVTRDVNVIGAASKYEGLRVKCIEDLWPGEGPLGGILTALIATADRPRSSVWNLILSCDMPFLTEEMLSYSVDRATRTDAEVVVPNSSRGLEPLCACWRTSARPVVEQQFNLGIRKVTSVFEHLRTEVLDEADWKRFDTHGRLFWNMNTLADYEEARRILERKKDDRHT